MFEKRILSFVNSTHRVKDFLQNFIPVLFILAILTLLPLDHTRAGPERIMDTDLFPPTEVLYSIPSNADTVTFLRERASMTGLPPGSTSLEASEQLLSEYGSHPLLRLGSIIEGDRIKYHYPPVSTEIDSELTFLHNTSSLHSMPVHMAEYFEASMKAATNESNLSYTVRNHPLPFTDLTALQLRLAISIFTAFFVLFPMAYIPANYMAWTIRENTNLARRHQIISGVKTAAYWIGNYMWDVIKFSVVASSIFLVFLWRGDPAYTDTSDRRRATFLLLLLYGTAAIPFSYMFSFLFTDYKEARIVITNTYFLISFALVIVSTIMAYASEDAAELNGKLRAVLFRLSPSFVLGEGMVALAAQPLFDILDNKESNPLDFDIIGKLLLQLVIESGVYLTATILFDLGFLKPIVVRYKLRYYLDVFQKRFNPDGDIMETLMMEVEEEVATDAEENLPSRYSETSLTVDSRKRANTEYEEEKKKNKLDKTTAKKMNSAGPEDDKKGKNEDEEGTDDDDRDTRDGLGALDLMRQVSEDSLAEHGSLVEIRKALPLTPSTMVNESLTVLQERQRVKHDSGNSFLVVDDLVKIYPNPYSPQLTPIASLRGISFRVQQGECFGLLGAGHSGKSTILRLIAGVSSPTKGSVRLLGVPPKWDSVGYMPSASPLSPGLTVRYVLTMYARIRGVGLCQARNMADDMVVKLGLKKAANTITNNLTVAQRRFLNLGMALMCAPKLLLLDEPTMGLDGLSRRRMWTLIKDFNRICTIVIATNSMDETEALCDRIGLLEHGILKSLGTFSQLTDTFSVGYQISIVARTSTPRAMYAELKKHLTRTEVMEAEHDENRYVFFVDHQDIPLSHLFDLVSGMKEKYKIKSFAITEATIEHIMTTVMKRARDTENYQRYMYISNPAPARWYDLFGICHRHRLALHPPEDHGETAGDATSPKPAHHKQPDIVDNSKSKSEVSEMKEVMGTSNLEPIELKVNGYNALHSTSRSPEENENRYESPSLKSIVTSIADLGDDAEPTSPRSPPVPIDEAFAADLSPDGNLSPEGALSPGPPLTPR